MIDWQSLDRCAAESETAAPLRPIKHTHTHAHTQTRQSVSLCRCHLILTCASYTSRPNSLIVDSFERVNLQHRDQVIGHFSLVPLIKTRRIHICIRVCGTTGSNAITFQIECMIVRSVRTEPHIYFTFGRLTVHSTSLFLLFIAAFMCVNTNSEREHKQKPKPRTGFVSIVIHEQFRNIQCSLVAVFSRYDCPMSTLHTQK